MATVTNVVGLNTVNGDKRIAVQTSYQYVDLMRSIGGGRWNPEGKHWWWPLEPMSALKLNTKLPPMFIRTPGFTGYLKELERVATVVEDGGGIPITKTEPWGHQLKAYNFAKGRPGILLDMFMGTGKTKVTIDLIQNEGDKRVLVLCPKKVVPVWPVQFERHCAIPYRYVALDTGTNTQRLNMAKQAWATTKADTLLVVVINYDSARNDPFATWALAQAWDRVVFDESHKLKAPGGSTSRFAHTLSRRAKKRLGLTGTPLPHSPLDAYAQYRAIDERVFGTSFASFKSQYAVMGGFENRQVLGFQNEVEFQRRFHSIAITIPKDVLDLPPEFHIRPPDMPFATLGKEARGLYEQLADDFMAEFDGGEIVADNALEQLLRLHQIAGGFLDGTRVDTSKEEILEELLDDIDPTEPVVIFALFRPELDVIHAVAKKLERRSLELSGRKNQLDSWPQDGTILAVQIQAGGVGIDLTASHYGIYYSKSFSLGDYDQSLARIHRPGQTNNTTYYHLLSENTVDIKIERALSERRDVVKAILAGGLR